MTDNSILDQIITNHKAEEVSKLDAVEINNKLFNELNERERDVLTRRFGLSGKNKETLESIGKAHKLTRERIRQVESSGIKKLKQIKELQGYVDGLKKVITQLIEEHGGIIEREYLLNNLTNLSLINTGAKSVDESAHKSNFDFLISRLLNNDFEEVKNSKNFKDSYKLKFESLDHLEELASELLTRIKEAKQTFLTPDIVELIKDLDSFKKYKDKFNTSNTIDISNVLKSKHFEEDSELINASKSIYSILQAHKYIDQNKFGYWGKYNSREIKPKTINDKIFLILKNSSKPLHFVEIAEKINEINFNKRLANAATVHNELILDDKYVLVGRGLYGLKEWGYKEGTVADVIFDIFKKNEGSLTRDEIIEKVMEQRLVKKATIILALMDKKKFEKSDNGKYKVKAS